MWVVVNLISGEGRGGEGRGAASETNLEALDGLLEGEDGGSGRAPWVGSGGGGGGVAVCCGGSRRS